MKVLICGSRDWDDDGVIHMVLTALRPHFVIHGGARGADAIADATARKYGLAVETFPADWRGQGKAAGHIRNKLMLEQKPDMVFAFKDGFDRTLERGGTENMVRIANEAGVPTYVISHGSDAGEQTRWHGA